MTSLVMVNIDDNDGNDEHSKDPSLTRLVLLMMLGLRMLRIFKMLQDEHLEGQGGNRMITVMI